jgi:phosphogluconate dehydratase
MIRLDATTGQIEALVPDLDSRDLATPDLTGNGTGVGRELFAMFRANVGAAATGAAVVV